MPWMWRNGTGRAPVARRWNSFSWYPEMEANAAKTSDPSVVQAYVIIPPLENPQQ